MHRALEVSVQIRAVLEHRNQPLVVFDREANVVVKNVDPGNLVKYIFVDVLVDIINVFAELPERRKLELLLDVIVLAHRQELG